MEEQGKGKQGKPRNVCNLVLNEELKVTIERVAEKDGVSFTAAARLLIRLGSLVYDNPKLTGKKALKDHMGRTDFYATTSSKKRGVRKPRYSPKDFFEQVDLS